MAVLFAVRDGYRDARTGRSPYCLDTAARSSDQRRGRLVEGVKATVKVVVLGVVIDTAYQLRVLGRFYPGEAFGFALLLGFIPYLLIRGPADRVVRWLSAHREMAMTKPTKPNILVIWGDDIGIWNLSCYHRGMMGGTRRRTSTASRREGIALHRLLRAAELHGRPGGLHHGSARRSAPGC